jgi:diacylglycerol kinase family enzyme
MNFYCYDAFLREKKYEVLLARIESRLFRLGIQGKSEKLTVLKSMKEVVEGGLKRGAETLIVVGDDQTLSKMIRLCADRDVILGFIPAGKRSTLGHLLGIPEGEKACDVLAARMIERLDIGKANDIAFLSFLSVTPTSDLLIECDDRYTIEPLGPHAVTVMNFGFPEDDPFDGKLEVVLAREGTTERGFFGRKAPYAESIFSIRSLRVQCFKTSVAAYADGQTVVKTPFSVTVEPKKVRMIVGKKRVFE